MDIGAVLAQTHVASPSIAQTFRDVLKERAKESGSILIVKDISRMDTKTVYYTGIVDTKHPTL